MFPIIALLAKVALSGGNNEKDSSKTLPNTQVFNNAFSGLEFDDVFDGTQPRVGKQEDLWPLE